MPQSSHQNTQTIIQPSKTQSLQLNRLIQFIQNKKSPSSKQVKEILLSKDCPLSKGQSASDKQQKENRTQQKSQRDSVAMMSTRNIFVARNKTESSSPRVAQNTDSKYCKIFVTKQEILKLHEKERSQYLPGGMREKFNFNLITNPEERHKSNLFPPLAVPRTKRAMIFNKYEDETTKWLNTEIKSIQEALNESIEPGASMEENRGQKANQLYLQREKYNKSLQKLIEKAFRSKQKLKSSPLNLNTIIQGIHGYDSRLVIHGQNYSNQTQHKQESVYASKGKLLSNPSLKIKRDGRFKSQRRYQADKLTITIDAGQLPVANAEIKRVFEGEHRRRIIHTNRQASYMESSIKLKTEVTSKPADYLPTSIRTRSHKKALKLISELQSSIINEQDEGEKSVRKIKGAKMMDKIRDVNNQQNGDLALESKEKNESQKLRRKREERKLKAKTLHQGDMHHVGKKSAAKWDLAGYDWKQSTDELQENMELQNYVQKIVKKSDPFTVDQKLDSNQQ